MKFSARPVLTVRAASYHSKGNTLFRTAFLGCALLIGILFAGTCSAMTVGTPDLQSSVDQADVIVEGQVVGTVSAWVEDQRGRHIYTTVTLQVSQILKGDAQPEINIEVIGGTVEEITEWVSDTPIFSEGMQAVLLLKEAPLRLIPGEGALYQVHDGKVYADGREFRVEEFTQVIEGMVANPGESVDEQIKSPLPMTFQAVLTPDLRASSVSGPSVKPAAAGTNAAYGALVQQTIVSETFEGGFPTAGWTVSGTPTWDETNYYSHGGSYSAWCAKTTLSPPAYYANYMNAWMKYGPFSLADATNAWMDFWFRIKTQINYDKFYWLASTNGTNFYGSGISGNSGGWYFQTLDLTSVPTLGDLRGQSQVWIAFIFQSDASTTDEGAFVDDICIYKETGGGGQPSITGFTPIKMSAGTGSGTDSQVTIAGTNFGSTQGNSKVEFFYKTYKPKIDAPIISWANTQIVCTVPTATVEGYPASSSSGAVTVRTSGGTATSNFKVTFAYGGAKWSAPVGYRINENTSDCTEEGAQVQAAASIWNNACPGFSFRYDGAHSNTVASGNYFNDILWGTTSGSLATTYYWSSGSQLLECDTVFNDAYAWSTNGAIGTYDIQTVGVHELGHWLNLRDLYGNLGDGQYDTAKIMYGSASSGTTKRNLHTDDADGIRWIYGTSLTSPTSASADPAAICSGGSSILTAVGGSGDELRWSTTCHGTVLVGTGNPISVSPTADTTYYAWWHNSGGDSDCVSVSVTVKQPTIILSNPLGFGGSEPGEPALASLFDPRHCLMTYSHWFAPKS